jgi:CHAD domain-containing protein
VGAPREPAQPPARGKGGDTPGSGKAAGGEPAGLVVGKTPGVTADDIVAEAGRKVLRFHLARLIAREAGTRSGEDPEDLHAMRVATRRMRAAWRVFGDGFRTDGTRKFRNRLRDVARRLGAVRDIDVLVMALDEYRAELPAAERKALEPLLDDWRDQREVARAVLMRELDSDGYRRFIDDYRAFVLTPGAGALAVSPTDPHHVRDTAASRIWQAYEHVLAYGPVLRWADVPTLHQLRIAGKWLRYTLEFVAEALGPEAKPLIERVVAMQDQLGLMNDAEVSAMKARALLVARSGTLTDAQTAAIARYLTSREREVARLKRGAAVPWRALASPTFRRGLGRAVAILTAVPTQPGG